MGDQLTIKYGAVTRMVFHKSDPHKVVGVDVYPNDNGHGNAPNGSRLRKSEVLPCDAVVIAMGPWSKQAFSWFPECAQLQHVSGTKANSIVVQPTFDRADHDADHGLDDQNDIKMDDSHSNDGDGVSCFDGQLFLEHKAKNGKVVGGDGGIEVYPRPDGSVYSCCHSKNKPLPVDPSSITNDERDSQMIYKGLQQLSSKYMANSKVLVKQACYLPGSADGVPLIGPITGYSNAFVGTGHTCWGILNAPATGMLLSEFVADGKVTSFKKSVLRKWDPSRK